jgi:Flp pilus assembly protein CpaB
MRSRGLVVAIAVVLAVLAAVGVIVYTQGVKNDPSGTVEVVVATQAIRGGTPLDPLVTAGAFDLIRIPDEAYVSGAIRSIDELNGAVAAVDILAGEQIPQERLAGEEAISPLAISDGNVGLGLSIAGPQSVNGFIGQGAYVVVYATYGKGTPVTQATLREALSPQQIDDFYAALLGEGVANPADQPIIFLPFDFTVTLIKSVVVASVQNPPVDTATNRKSSGESLLVLDLTPEDATNIVYATGHAQLYLGLLPKNNKDGYDSEAAVGVPLVKVTGVAK